MVEQTNFFNTLPTHIPNYLLSVFPWGYESWRTLTLPLPHNCSPLLFSTLRSSQAHKKIGNARCSHQSHLKNFLQFFVFPHSSKKKSIGKSLKVIHSKYILHSFILTPGLFYTIFTCVPAFLCAHPPPLCISLLISCLIIPHLY